MSRPLRGCAAAAGRAGRCARRLVLAVLALLALVSVGIGGLTTVALRHFLIDQLDDQLAAGDRRCGGRPARERPRVARTADRGGPAGPPPGTVAAGSSDGRVVARPGSCRAARPEHRPVRAESRPGRRGRRAGRPAGRRRSRAPSTSATAATTGLVARAVPDGDVRVVAVCRSPGVQETVLVAGRRRRPAWPPPGCCSPGGRAR